MSSLTRAARPVVIVGLALIAGRATGNSWTDDPSMWAFFVIVAFIVGTVMAAWIGDDRILLAESQRDQARKDAREANERAALAAAAAENERAEREWMGGYK